jgi:acyl carrier protein
VPDRTVDLAELRAGMEAVEPPAVDGEHRMFRLGPRWHCFTGMSVRDTERLVELSLPARFAADLDAHPVHPALLDCATSVVRDVDEPFHLPFLYRRMTVHGRLPHTVTAVVRRMPSGTGLIVADVDLVDPDGRVVVAVEGFTLRRVDPEAFLPAAEEPAAERPPAGPVDPPPAGALGIAPEHGVRILLSLIDGGVAGQVAVRPHVDGRPVPIPSAGRPETDPVAGPPPPDRLPGPPEDRLPTGPAPAASPEAALPPDAVPAAAVVGGVPAAVPGPGGPAPDTGPPTVDALRELWRQVLGIDRIGPDDDFFELGGNSLTAVELMSRIRDRYAIELSIALLFDAPTLDALARAIDTQGGR